MQRKRGVKASRLKLQRYMFEAGFSTQVALAERMAEIEGSDTVPKDIVNRVFRETAVSPHTLERIANALNVPAYELYLSSAEIVSSLNEIEQPTPHSKSTIRKPTTRFIITLTIAVSLLSLVLLLPKFSSNRVDAKVASKPLLTSTLGRASIVIASSSTLAETLTPVVESSLKTYNGPSHIHSLPEPDSYQQTLPLLTHYQVDAVLYFKQQTAGRYHSIQAILTTHERSQLIAHRLTPAVNAQQQTISWANDLLKRLPELTHNSAQPEIDLLVTAYQQQLEGWDLLDDTQSPTSIKSAQSRFLLSEQLLPNDANNAAGLCAALTHESWMSNEKLLLEQATKHCDRAQALQADNPRVLTSQALLLRRTGRAQEVENLLLDYPLLLAQSSDMMQELAYSFLTRYQQSTEELTLIEQARLWITRAITLEPDFWRNHLIDGLIAWTVNDEEKAEQAYKRAYAINQNPMIATNLGSVALCRGEIEPAILYFDAVRQRSPDAYFSYEMLGLVKYVQGEFESSMQNRRKAIELAGDAGIHQMWGGLADSLFMLNESAQAIASYQQAITVIDRDFARGNQTQAEQIFKLYYQMQLARIGNKLTDFIQNHASSIDQLNQQLDDASVPTLVRLAMINLQAKQDALANNMLEKAAETCPIYAKLPEFTEIQH